MVVVQVNLPNYLKISTFTKSGARCETQTRKSDDEFWVGDFPTFSRIHTFHFSTYQNFAIIEYMRVSLGVSELNFSFLKSYFPI